MAMASYAQTGIADYSQGKLFSDRAEHSYGMLCSDMDSRQQPGQAVLRQRMQTISRANSAISCSLSLLLLLSFSTQRNEQTTAGEVDKMEQS